MVTKHKFVPYKDLRPVFGETRSRNQLRRDPEYPTPRQMSPQRIAWVFHELERHYASRPAVKYPTSKSKKDV